MNDESTDFIEGQDRSGMKPPETAVRPRVPWCPEPDKHEGRTGFTKIFRWQVPADRVPAPTQVEVVGSFTEWRKVPLSYDPPTRTWQVMQDHIEGNQTHRYVILVDGKPSYDQTCDGLVAPQTAEEAQWGIATPRGLRVMLLFSQTK